MSKEPRPLLENIWAFAPNRETLGGTAYFLQESRGNVLIDCPSWDETNEFFLQEKGGVKWLFLTHRGGISKVKEIQQKTGCDILIQEQEAYYLPGLMLTVFDKIFSFNESLEAIWTSGYSPGSSCLYYQKHGGVLFTGRHLLPDESGNLNPIKTSKTFHWLRQLKSVDLLLERFTPETLKYICPGAHTGFLRGKGLIDLADQKFLNFSNVPRE